MPAYKRATVIAQRSGARLHVIRCGAPQAVRAHRLACRVAGPSQWAVDRAPNNDQERWYTHLPLGTLVLTIDRLVEDVVVAAPAFLVPA